MKIDLKKRFSLPEDPNFDIFYSELFYNYNSINENLDYSNLVSIFTGNKGINSNSPHFPYLIHKYKVTSVDNKVIHMCVFTKDNWDTCSLYISKEFHDFCIKHRSKYVKSFINDCASQLSVSVYTFRSYLNNYVFKDFLDKTSLREKIDFLDKKMTSLNVPNLYNRKLIQDTILKELPKLEIKIKSLQDLKDFDKVVKEVYMGIATTVVEEKKLEVVELDEADMRALGMVETAVPPSEDEPEEEDDDWGQEDDDWGQEDEEESEEETVAVAEEAVEEERPLPF